MARPYSTAFKPRNEGRIYQLDRIPASLWEAVRAKARRENVSLRYLLLTLVSRWLAGEIVVEPDNAGS